MQRKGNKFSRNKPKKADIQSKKKNSIQTSPRLKEKCGCGSGKSFENCCFRSDHKRFNLSKYLLKLKDIKLKMQDLVISRLIEEYQNNPELREIADNLSYNLNLPIFQQIIDDIKNKIDIVETKGDVFMSAIRFEALTIDWTLPGQNRPFFQEALQFYIHKASERIINCYKSLSESQYSMYEVIEVKKAQGYDNTWIRIRDLFTKKEFVVKDPIICSEMHIWDVIVGRLYRVAGFNLFSTATLILTPGQQKTFNRIVFMLWLKDMCSMKPIFLKRYLAKYPDLKMDFCLKHASFSKEYFYNAHLRNYLKMKSPEIAAIMGLMNRIAPEYPLIVKSPDYQKFLWSESIGEINENKKSEIVELIRSDVKNFHETIPAEETQEYSFDYLLPNEYAPKGDEIMDLSLNPEDLINLNMEEITREVCKLNQNIVIIGTSSISLDDSFEEVVESIENLNRKSTVKAGFINISGKTIKLVTFSRKSMESLRNHVNTMLDPFLTSLSPPIYTDLLNRARHNTYYPSTYEDLTSIENMILNEDPFKPIDDLLYLPEQISDNEEEFIEMEDEQDIDLMSWMVRRTLMKRWVDQKIPYLGGKSPREVLKEKKNINILIDLIKEKENSADRQGEFNPQDTYSTLLNLNLERMNDN